MNAIWGYKVLQGAIRCYKVQRVAKKSRKRLKVHCNLQMLAISKKLSRKSLQFAKAENRGKGEE